MSTENVETPRHQRSPVPSEPAPARRAIVAAAIGNMLEAYDFAIYGFFFVIISRLYFPVSNEVASLLLAVGTFGVGFAMRPIGAVVLGSLADRKGRKVALSITILAMAVGTAMIGLAPSYEAIGMAAPVIIVLARLIQGFSAGGEFGAATAFLVEHAPPERRGFFASWQQGSQVAALLLGSSLATVLTAVLPTAALESWGWRVPFLLGLVIGPVGYFIRKHTEEPREYRSAVAARPASPLGDALRDHRRGLAAGFGITVGWTVCTYFLLVYMPTYAVREFGLPAIVSFASNSAGLLVMLALVPVAGMLADRLPRGRLMVVGVGAVAALLYPALALLSAYPSTWSLLLFQCGFAVLLALFTGVAPAAMAEVYPPEVRSTGISIAYSFAVAIFGGFTPFVATWLIEVTGSGMSPALYVVAACALSAVMIVTLYGRGREPAGRTPSSPPRRAARTE